MFFDNTIWSVVSMLVIGLDITMLVIVVSSSVKR